ncbi:TonB-dependent hemoglobin/transferrin/lactoferrin family receptor [Brenneria tiliae]|uniref:TonB-dependent hemoglobin/transferrin/lactoferrin family receptor n=1 Tax=Brenneria tiliae TaxID=2914984 RepID=A0ABT0MTA9_9GAMM|nr:TonB-dependent hemoglobin/transferrin/lactoferrin family receptor [Brenneria tiliae]MCL2892807.1 TonB-dependent hemoglobin/transferrin/lactoferrin family receptor [Brenneria tiliae]
MIINKILLTGVLAGVAFNGAAASAQNQTASASQSEPTGDVMTVYSPKIERKAGSEVTITADEMQKNGGNDFSNIMRYQPLISAPGVSSGVSAGKSGYDRGGASGYNIRGLENNRVSIDIDGVELPSSTDRGTSTVSGRRQTGSTGIGRGDYLDPYLYGSVDIESGATSVDNSNNALGGSVSFKPKSANDYLNIDKHGYFGYQAGYDSANRSFHNGITAAGGDDTLRGVVVISRRDGNETENHHDAAIDSTPANWHSNAVLASAIWQATNAHQLTATVDYYHKTNHADFPTWTMSASGVSSLDGSTSYQDSQTRRWGFSLTDLYTPQDFALFDSLNTKLFYTQTEAHDYTVTDASTPTSVWSNYDTNGFGLESKAAKEWRNHSISYGFNARQQRTERPFTAQNLTAGGMSIDLGRPQADSKIANVGAFVQDKITWELAGRDFAVVPGVRFAWQHAEPKNASNLFTNTNGNVTSDEAAGMYGTNADGQVMPSIAFQYHLTPDLLAYVQYRRGAQFPTDGQLYGSWALGYFGTSSSYAVLSDPDLKTETSDNYELGLKGQIVEGVTLSAAAFYSDYKNFIANGYYRRADNPALFARVPDSISTLYLTENRDKAYIYGGEISAQFNLGTWFERANGFKARLAYGYSEGASKSSANGDSYVNLDSVTPQKAVVGIAYDDPSNTYGAALTATFNKGKTATYAAGRKLPSSGNNLGSDDYTFMRVPGHGLVDLSAYYRLSPNVRLSGGIYNLTDRKYWDYQTSRNIEAATSNSAGDINYYNQQLAVAPGRTFQLGVNVDF